VQVGMIYSKETYDFKN